MRSSSRTVLGAVSLLLLLLAVASPAAASNPDDRGDPPRWTWPLTGPHVVVAEYRAPAHDYGPGHRGVDLGASVDAVVVAPADGVVAFRGGVVDRPLLTVTHADGLVTTFEPLRSTLAPGDAVSAGQALGYVDVGGHSPPGALHLGVRLDGAYINPMLLFGDVPRAVLLPCCASR
ncbi:murein hydrolase activator EnvC [Microbacterium sp. MYb62]|uniref:murein hydrolase activator EnvC family protein n=1 Tax=Microbacterium sp. MYb62 TaxID=1848690 RepID=UPI000CFCA4C7|nr:M23 family metallopeptidase [Microbacterium sp. MYb62]PRB18946.1 peptidase M23 [Microbacterium sp. MYb62]